MKNKHVRLLSHHTRIVNRVKELYTNTRYCIDCKVNLVNGVNSDLCDKCEAEILMLEDEKDED